MGLPARRLTDLLGSRICHDLISPIGAISNGVELISMSGDLSGPEMSLIADSVRSANARIRFYRIAYGLASADQRVGRAEAVEILAELFRGGRLHVNWQPEGDLPRALTKLIFLLLQCFESAMPRGGAVHVSVVGDQCAIQGNGEQIRVDEPLWTLLEMPMREVEVVPATVHFPLAGLCAQDLARKPVVEYSEDTLRVRF